MTGNLNLRIAVHAHAAVLHLAERLGRHLDELREEDDRGNNDVSMIMWIVAVVVFAGAAIAAFKILGQGKLDGMTGL
ncbi:hypothetical protein PYK79_17545 [Streptomyces sp. ID05-04B]|jgi:hypothetical protein|uniref:Uncharacterized protein n=2 Tax=Streptomyces TaxID=1883 RepID=G2G433_9ACTN|nr:MULTISPECIES: hypothetical protein [Streptomyces]EGX61929.1 hypothetical protein SZN_01170 [Streptomyces zinciresistens K42]MDT0616668.1 hypothetical protein [Streptomyces sp. DSM 40712]MDX5564815.1 hypothetical protein [Streptomyces sp. ID05-04B]